MLPRVLLHVLLLLGHLHRFLLWAFHAVGLGDLIDLGVNYPLPSSSSSSSPAQQQQHGQGQGQHGWTAASSLQHRRPVLIDEALPVVRFDELSGTGTDCAVCLCGIAGGDEVRQLGNCRHAFHRGCLDRWMAHDQRTCPLCRAPLLPGDLCAAADYDLFYPSLLSGFQ
ncbi:hypothetical protein PR202_gb09374 [Eleusine coracana subsp. coracana]|uniref:RING-type domain-containing protein n=1 Tax=Eleusine coracana subsp. coracana TaxID=191504 RepID=A0AAV5EER1_ELECO|nr:hypothetical protein PR202_gb09374 [Eleusine coracana subsp. coracana]